MSAQNKQKQYWGETYGWSQGGEEWSGPWGNSWSQWYGTILPRIQAFVPTGTILEIAPGFGRWTRFLKNYCNKMILVDVADRCIEACRQRFHNEIHLSYYVNDGQSLDMVPDDSLDFVFSFDSLVHVEVDTITAYLRQLHSKLTANGIAFLHHSNIAEYKDYFERLERLKKIREPLARLGLIERTGHGRARSMSASKFVQLVKEAGLICISQELINWNTHPSHLIDCFSVVTLPGSKFVRPFKIMRNSNFMHEANATSKLALFHQNLMPIYQRYGEFENRFPRDTLTPVGE